MQAAACQTGRPASHFVYHAGRQLRCAAAMCRWDMMECGAGFTYDADTNLTGPEAVRFTMQAAASNGLTLVRSFGHGHDAFKSIILQPRAGANCPSS